MPDLVKREGADADTHVAMSGFRPSRARSRVVQIQGSALRGALSSGAGHAVGGREISKSLSRS
jgi:hypothetical protein